GERLDGLGAALEVAALETPRGRIEMDAATHLTRAPLYLREVRWRGSVASNEVVAELRPLRDPERQIATLRSGLKTGWVNEYPCACPGAAGPSRRRGVPARPLRGHPAGGVGRLGLGARPARRLPPDAARRARARLRQPVPARRSADPPGG